MKSVAVNLQHINYKIAFNMRIHQVGNNQFYLDLRLPDRWGGDSLKPHQINMNPQELNSHNALMQERIAELAILLETKQWQKMSDSDKEKHLKEHLAKLARAGYLAYQKIFGDVEMLNWLNQWDEKPAVIEIISSDFFLPWELLYPVDPRKELAWEYFWGFQYLISRRFPLPSVSASFLVPPDIDVKNRPSLGLLADTSLPHVETEISFFKRRKDNGELDLEFFDDIDPDFEIEGLEKLEQFLSHTLNIVHFACHASYDHENHLKSYLSLSKNFELRLEHLEQGLSIPSRPMVMLNACETGNMNSLYTSFFAQQFYVCGARGVVATECVIPDAFASEFANQLYRYLLKGLPLGQALFESRWHFWNSVQKPTGLIYSMYAQPSVRLKYGGKNE